MLHLLFDSAFGERMEDVAKGSDKMAIFAKLTQR